MTEEDWEFLPSWGAPKKEILPYEGLGGFLVCKDDYPISGCWLVVNKDNTEYEIVHNIYDTSYQDSDKNKAIELLHEFTNFIGESITSKQE